MHIMYLPSEIVAYIADFCSATRQATLRRVCKQFAIAIIADIRQHGKCRKILDKINAHTSRESTMYTIVLIKWNRVLNNVYHPVPINGKFIYGFLLDGKSSSKYCYKYGLLLYTGAVEKKYSDFIAWCYSTQVTGDMQECTNLLLSSMLSGLFKRGATANERNGHIISCDIDCIIEDQLTSKQFEVDACKRDVESYKSRYLESDTKAKGYKMQLDNNEYMTRIIFWILVVSFIIFYICKK